VGGQNMCDIHLILKRVVALHFDGLLEEGIHDWMHFLGTSKLEWAVMLTDIQRAVRANYNPAFTVSFDCASPFLATANGQIYTDLDVKDKGKWTYRMQPSIDHKQWSTSTRMFEDVVTTEHRPGTTQPYFELFDGSPVMDLCTVKDVCIYKPGDLNKIGKEGKTSWDSFSYTIQMAHNVWTHINAVQTANERYDAGDRPGMLIPGHNTKKSAQRPVKHFNNLFQEVEPVEENDETFRNVVHSIFAAPTREEANEIIESHTSLWKQIIGTRGASGKKAVNASTMYDVLFDSQASDTIEDNALDDLEHTQDDEK